MGFDASSYTVHEDEGDVEVCVVVQQSVTIDFSFQLTLSAAPGSPGMCSYISYTHVMATKLWLLLHS